MSFTSASAPNGRVKTWRRLNEAAVRLEVDSGKEPTSGREPVRPKIEEHAAAGVHRPGVRQRTMASNEIAQRRGPAVPLIDIQHDEALPGPHANIR